MSKLLINEPPLQVLPKLAALIGLNEALILQQLHYWVERSSHVRDGRKWIYNTYEEWHKQFPFWSVSTIRRGFDYLRKYGYVIVTSKYNGLPSDSTLWYTIDYETVERLSDVGLQGGAQYEQGGAQYEQGGAQYEQGGGAQYEQGGGAQYEHTITRDYNREYNRE